MEEFLGLYYDFAQLDASVKKSLQYSSLMNRGDLMTEISQLETLGKQLATKKKEIEGKLNLTDLFQLQADSQTFIKLYSNLAYANSPLDFVDKRKDAYLLPMDLSKIDGIACTIQPSGLPTNEEIKKKHQEAEKEYKIYMAKARATNLAASAFYKALDEERNVADNLRDKMLQMFGLIGMDIRMIDRMISNKPSQLTEYKRISESIDQNFTGEQNDVKFISHTIKRHATNLMLKLLEHIRRYEGHKMENSKTWKVNYPHPIDYIIKKIEYWQPSVESLLCPDVESHNISREKLGILIKFFLKHIIDRCLFTLPLWCQPEHSVIIDALTIIWEAQGEDYVQIPNRIEYTKEILTQNPYGECYKSYLYRYNTEKIVPLYEDSEESITKCINENTKVNERTLINNSKMVTSIIYKDMVSSIEPAALLTIDTGLLSPYIDLSDFIKTEFQPENQNISTIHLTSKNLHLRIYPVKPAVGNACLMINHYLTTFPKITTPSFDIVNPSTPTTHYAPIIQPSRVFVNSNELITDFPFSIAYDDTKLTTCNMLVNLPQDHPRIRLCDAIESIKKVLTTIDCMIIDYGLIPSNFYQDIAEKGSKDDDDDVIDQEKDNTNQSICIMIDKSETRNPYLLVLDWLNGFRVVEKSTEAGKEFTIDDILRSDIETIVYDLLFLPYNPFGFLSPVYESMGELVNKVNASAKGYSSIKELLTLKIFNMDISKAYYLLTTENPDDQYTKAGWSLCFSHPVNHEVPVDQLNNLLAQLTPIFKQCEEKPDTFNILMVHIEDGNSEINIWKK